MTTIRDLTLFLESRAPLHLAEEWDNVGLLLGAGEREARRVMTCLTLTATVVEEAVAEKVDLVVTHHPLPFHPLRRVTAEDAVGARLLRLAEARTAVYSAHTAFDSTADGINELWARRLGLNDLEPLEPRAEQPALGAGRVGNFSLPRAGSELASRVKELTGLARLRGVGLADREFLRVAIACGSGGSLLESAARCGAELFLTGEASFHQCLAAESLGMGLILTGHYASERFALEQLAEELSEAFGEVEVWASRRESDVLVEV